MAAFAVIRHLFDIRQSSGITATDDHLRYAQEEIGLLVLGGSLVQSQVAGARYRGLDVDFA